VFEGFSNAFVREAINRSAENDVDRRRFLRAAGLTTAGVAGASMLGTGVASATESTGPSDAAILNFALNLEYLEAEFYLRAYYGEGLKDGEVDGKGKLGGVRGGHKVRFRDRLVTQYAREIAEDERKHVNFLRGALGEARVARPEINLDEAFTAAATAAGLVKKGQKFDAFADENSFLLGAFVFEDVGVTAYKGAAALIDSKAFLEAAAGILAVEAYHAGLIRTVLLARDLDKPANAISDARDSLDGKSDLDQGVTVRNKSNIVPTDENSIAFSRSPGQVLNIVYLNPKKVTSGGFFPAGVNGELNTSG